MNFLKIKFKNNSFGLLERDMRNMRGALFSFSEIEKAVIFGFRAKENYKQGSDIDIAIFGKNITNSIVSKISSILNEELPIPYFIDVVHFDSLKNNDLRNHIIKRGKTIYTIQQIIHF